MKGLLDSLQQRENWEELKEFIDMMGIYVDNEEEEATEAECEGVSERLVYLKGAGLPADQ